jgi:hypothetical protein
LRRSFELCWFVDENCHESVWYVKVLSPRWMAEDDI